MLAMRSSSPRTEQISAEQHIRRMEERISQSRRHWNHARLGSDASLILDASDKLVSALMVKALYATNERNIAGTAHAFFTAAGKTTAREDIGLLQDVITITSHITKDTEKSAIYREKTQADVVCTLALAAMSRVQLLLPR